MKKATCVDKNGKKPLVAMIISRDGLVDLLGPLGFAITEAACDFDVSIYFMGPGVKVLHRNYKGLLPGLWAPFSRFARKGMEGMGHVSAKDKLEQLRSTGATFYVCHPSLVAMNIKLSSLSYQDEIILAEYAAFLEVMKNAAIALCP